ncbi:hypothetical protein JYG30_19725 [Fibrella sp. USSR17]
MIRVLFDEHGGYTNDLFIIIDASPSKVFVSDTTWLGDFFGPHDPNSDAWLLDEEQLLLIQKQNVASLIRLWIDSLLSDQQVCYLPINLSDQSSLAFQITKAKKLIYISEASTTDIVDGTSETYFSKNQPITNWKVIQNRQWAIAPKSILTGLKWSLARLELPTIPLQYE